MNFLEKYIKGDIKIWAIVIFLILISVPVIYSSATNLVIQNSSVTTITIITKHILSILVSLCIIYISHKIDYRYYKKPSLFLLSICIFILTWTLFQTNFVAKRWFTFPYINLSFQPSILSKYVLIIYASNILSSFNVGDNGFKKYMINLFLPVLVVCILIFIANFSTAVILFISICFIIIIEGKAIKYLVKLILMVFSFGILFYFTVKMFPNTIPHRLDTMKSRIDKFLNDKDSHQLTQSKIAIASGGIFSFRPGKSIQKNFLPQSTSDFVFPIIIEEYGLLGGAAVIFLYIVLLWRFFNVSYKSDDLFAKLLSSGIGLMFVFQAFINMGVSVGLIPITGQQLPFISSGWTSFFILSWVIGIVINISYKNSERE